MKLLTGYQANRIQVGGRIMRRKLTRPSIKSLTCCQVNSTRVGVRIVRM